MSHSQPRHFFLNGSFHGNNLGDLAILQTWIVWAKARGLRLTALSKDESLVRKRLGSTLGDLEFVHPTDFRKILSAVARSSEIIIGGGGLFFDDSFFSMIRIVKKSQLVFWVAITIFARLVGRKVTWRAVGVGPVRTKAGRFLVRLGCKCAHRICVRDQKSYNLLSTYGVKGKLMLTDDLVFTLVDPDLVATRMRSHLANFRSCQSQNRISIGLVLLNDSARREAYLELISEIKKCSGLPPTLFVTNPSMDHDFVREIAIQTGSNYIDTSFMTLEEFRASLSAYSFLISIRMHALLLAFQQGTPGIGLDIEKVESFQSALYGRDDLFIDLLNPAKIRASVNNIVTNMEQIAEAGLNGYRAAHARALGNYPDEIRPESEVIKSAAVPADIRAKP